MSGSLLLCYTFSFSQNLVVNGSFENAICPVPPSGTGQLSQASGWENPCSSGSTAPDLFSRCFDNTLAGGTCFRVSVPVNFAAGNCAARTGNNYAGIICYRSNNMLREYISSNLSVALIAGKVYKVGFYAKRAPNCRYATSGLAAYLSAGKPNQSGNGLIMQTPQISFATQLIDTTQWTLIEGYFLPQSNLNYITIGNFKNDAQSAILDLGSAPNTVCLDRNSYYFIEDVFVEEVVENLSIDGDTVVCTGGTTTLTASSTHPFWWSTASNPTDTFSLQQSITVNPLIEPAFILNGFFQKKSVSIDVISPPAVNLGADTTICEGETLQLHAANMGCNYVWSTNEKEEYVEVKNSGTYWVDVTNQGCTVSDTVNVNVELVPDISLGLDSLFCLTDYDSLVLDAGEGNSYLWSPTGETTRYKSVSIPGNYSVTVIYSNGCSNVDSITALETCQPKIFIPKAFSPNNDLLNDNFKPYATNILGFEMTIVNRWGQTVFNANDKAWDGKFKQKNAPQGVYVYQITCYIINEVGKRVALNLNGWVALIE